MTQKDLPYILKEINKLPINSIDIASNGTIIPNDELLQVLQIMGDKVSLHISDYSCVDDIKKKKIEEKVKEYGIHFYIYKFLYGSNEWFDSGKDNEEPIRDPEELKRSYFNCENRHCWVLAENHMASCGKILSLMKLNMENRLAENNVIDITEARREEKDFSEILNSFEDNWSHRIPYVCRWCKVDRNRIPAGIQMM